MGTYTDLIKLKPRALSAEDRELKIEQPQTQPQTEHSLVFQSNVAPTNLPEIGHSDMTESPNAILPDCLNARNMAVCVQEALLIRAAKKESFRFPQELIDALEDIPHQVKKEHKKRLSKTTIFVAALAAYLWDYRHNGKESLLYKQLIEQ